VGELVNTVAVCQPTVSKHLKVLRDNEFVACRTAANGRMYRIEARRLEALETWLAPYRALWTTNLDALECHLDDQENS
jgi:DNA-binding transcriptional ArsR family regulator